MEVYGHVNNEKERKKERKKERGREGEMDTRKDDKLQLVYIQKEKKKIAHRPAGH